MRYLQKYGCYHTMSKPFRVPTIKIVTPYHKKFIPELNASHFLRFKLARENRVAKYDEARLNYCRIIFHE